MTRPLKSAVLPFIIFFCATVGVARADQYVGSGTGAAIYIAWTASGGQLQGQVQFVGLSQDGASTKTTNASFVGVRSGSDISLTLGGLLGGTTWTGHFGFGTLTLDYPTDSGGGEMTLRNGTFADFQHLVSLLRSKAGHVSTLNLLQRAVADAGARIGNVYASINSNLLALSKELPNPPPDVTSQGTYSFRYAQAFKKMTDDWAREQALGSRAGLTCYQKSQVAYIASQVSYDHTQIQYIDSQVNELLSTIQHQLDAVSDGEGALPGLYSLYATKWREWQHYLNPAHPKPMLPGTKESISAITAAANAEITYATRRLPAVRAIYQSYDDKAAALDQTAKNYPNTLSCSG